MHLFNCLDPVAVKDHNGEIRYVPCGKCDYCRYVRSLSRIDRATNELRKHRFALLVTCTYHDAFLPLVSLNREYNLMYFSSHDDCDSFCNTDDGLVFSYQVPNAKEAALYYKIEKRYGGIPVLYKPDVQAFLKRVRSAIFYEICKKNKELYNEKFTFSYAYCGEYGPSTYRPHIHLLLMFDEERLLEFFSKNLYSLWQLGNLKQRIVNTSSEDAHYVAEYANSVHRLPTLYRQKMVAPFYETSRNGTFGFAKISSEEVERVFRTGSPEIVVQDMLSGERNSLSTPLYVARKLFPTFSGYSLLKRNDVLRLLRLCKQPGINSPKDLELTLYELDQEQHNSSDLSVWFSVFLRSSSYHMNMETPEDWSECMHYHYSKRTLNLAKSIFYCCNAYDRICDTFGVDLDYAVTRTFLYLDNAQKFRLKSQLEFEDTFYEDHPEWLIYLDNTKAPPSLSVMLSTEFGHSVSHVMNSIDHSHKNKRQNEYLAAHPEYSYINDFDSDSPIFNDCIV